MRTFLWRYLYQRRRMLAGFCAAMLIFACAFALYHLPIAAVMYPALICLVLGTIWLCIDIRRSYQHHVLLQRLKECITAWTEELPATDVVEARDYQDIISMLLKERDRLEEQMTERYQDMIRYYTLWAHQIKTPIASMKLQLQNMDDEHSRRLSLELRHIEQYVDMVLAFLRLGSNSTDYVFREASLDDVVRSAVKRFSGDFIQKKLRVEVEPTHLRLVTDEKWLRFVVEQLLSNAIKYTFTGGVRIYLEQPATLCIRDTGIGIAKEDLPRLGQNGFTGMNGRLEEKSSGLGLHLCHQVCEALGYAITIESEIDKGTCVKINLHKRTLQVE